MKSFSAIFTYLKENKSYLLTYFIFNLFAILFSLLSLAMLGPFLQLLFDPQQLVNTKPNFSFSGADLLSSIKYILSQLIISNGKTYALGMICLIVLGAIFFKNIFLYLSMRTMSPLKNGIVTRLRKDIYNKLLCLPIGFFTEQKKGDILSRVSNDVNEVESSVLSTLEGFINQPLQIIIILIALISISPMLSLFLIILLPLTGFIIGRVSRSLKKQSNTAQDIVGKIMSKIEETLSGLRVIKAFNAETIFKNQFNTLNKDLEKIKNNIQYRRDLASPMSEFLGVGVLCCILWFGGRLVLSGQAGLSADSFITYIVFFTQIINPAKSLSSAFYNVKKGTAAIERINTILKTPIYLKDKPNAISLSSFTQNIHFHEVYFKYGQKDVLKAIDLKIEKGKTIALVGASGSGKSTLADLIPRFHDVTGGKLTVDGINVQDCTIESLRNHISIVTQEAILFNDTIANNIALGVENIDMEQIEQAAKAANAYDFIMQKPEGFHTIIGDRGSKLSGGERQRITIARALLKNPSILILDEATSALDTESEKLVQEAIYKLMENRTSLVIAHRLSTIRHADEIVVMQRGKIVERGTHDRLIGLEMGIYKKLIEMQAVK